MNVKALARIIQNRCTAIKDAQTVSALQESMTGDDGTCFYVNDGRNGAIYRVNITEYKPPLI